MNRLRISWLRWRRNDALSELLRNQASFDVGPTYLVNTLIYINALQARIDALSTKQPGANT